MTPESGRRFHSRGEPSRKVYLSLRIRFRDSRRNGVPDNDSALREVNPLAERKDRAGVDTGASVGDDALEESARAKLTFR
jgi:hypothetical protein